jgi:3-oxoacyl-[acyl-carrier protein] reductase
MDLGLRGRAAFVAASSRGMGLAIARQFAAEGADVGMCARDATALDEAAASVREQGTRVVARAADVSDAEQAVQVVEHVADELGRLDALVLNAGGPPPGSFDMLDDAAWESAFELTMMSAVRMIRAALPHLRRSDAASIAFVSSYSVRQPIAGLTLSNGIRAGVAGLAKTLALELAPQIRVNTLLPGSIATGRALQLAQSRATPERSFEEVMRESAVQIP